MRMSLAVLGIAFCALGVPIKCGRLTRLMSNFSDPLLPNRIVLKTGDLTLDAARRGEHREYLSSCAKRSKIGPRVCVAQCGLPRLWLKATLAQFARLSMPHIYFVA